MTHDPRYQKGIDHFNAGEFYDAHETWESLWHVADPAARPFLQGLIQYATALHHFRKGNLKGARLLYDSGTPLLQSLGVRFWELPVEKLIASMTACVRPLLSVPVDDLPGRSDAISPDLADTFDEGLLPKIYLTHDSN